MNGIVFIIFIDLIFMSFVIFKTNHITANIRIYIIYTYIYTHIYIYIHTGVNILMIIYDCVASVTLKLVTCRREFCPLQIITLREDHGVC